MASLLVAWIDMMPVSTNSLIAYYGGALALIAFYHPILWCGLHAFAIFTALESRPIWRANSSRQHERDR
jgi:hypothetical protein